MEAGKTLGWNVTLVDGAFGADDGYNKGIRQAIAAHANGIILVSIDCNMVTEPLLEAKSAGLKVLGQSSFACTDDPSLMTPMNYSSSTPSLASFGQAEGVAQADYIIAKTDGKAKILSFRFVGNAFAIQITNGFNSEIARCTGCSVKDADITLSDYGTLSAFSRKVSSALLAAGDVDGVRVPFNSFITGGVGQAVVNAGKAANTLVVGSEGFEANLNLIREKRGQSAAIASDQQWIGWGSADAMNQVFAGGEPAPAGIGFKLVDRRLQPAAIGRLPFGGGFQVGVQGRLGKVNTFHRRPAFLQAAEYHAERVFNFFEQDGPRVVSRLHLCCRSS